MKSDVKTYGGMTTEERKEIFIRRAMSVHSDKNLDFSKVVYVNNRTKVCVIDHDLDKDGNEYGEFYITPTNLLKGRSHPRRKAEKTAERCLSDFEQVKKRFKIAHPGENLDYSKSVYKGMHQKILIIDHDLDKNGNEYGEYWQEVAAHAKGSGHPRKAIDRISTKNTLSTNEFIRKAVAVHGERYDYSMTEYVGYKTPVKIICRKHGIFEQTPDAHLEMKGCPKCGNHYSRFEDEIIEFINAKCGLSTTKGEKKTLGGKEIDIVVPEKNIGIEFDGLRWHTEFFAGKDKNYHLSKSLMAKENGISLIHIFEDEYVLHKEIVLSKIARMLGSDCLVEKKVDGRKCVIRKIEKEQSDIFLNSNHIQGSVKASLYLGATCGDELVAVMTFKNNGGGIWTLSRFASDIHSSCRGVFGKMLSFFKKNFDYEKIESFLDIRYCPFFDSNMYTKLGFSVESVEKPDYCYFNPQVDRFRRFHKFGFRKSILHRKYGLDMSMTELEMARFLGYDRIWNCGLVKYSLSHRPV